MRWAMRRVITVVLPVPAPATIRRGPASCVTAARCSSFRPSRMRPPTIYGRLYRRPSRDCTNSDRAGRFSARAAAGDARRRGGPPRVERVPRLVEIDDEGGVIGRQRLALTRLPVDLRPHRALGDRAGDEQMIDPHAEVLVKVPRPIIPPRVAVGIIMAEPVGVDQSPGAELAEGLALGL